MAGREIEGDLWDQSLGLESPPLDPKRLDLLPPIAGACAGFSTLSSANRVTIIRDYFIEIIAHNRV